MVMVGKSMRHFTISTIFAIVHPDSGPVYLPSVDTYRIYDGTDENEIVGTVAPGLFAQEGRCWRMVYRNAAGHGTHCPEQVAWVWRWKFLKGRTKVVGVASATPTSWSGLGIARCNRDD